MSIFQITTAQAAKVIWEHTAPKLVSKKILLSVSTTDNFLTLK